MKIKILVIITLAFCTNLYAQEEMYKWVNSAGITQYSQFPPKGVKGVERVGGEKKPRTLGDIENSGKIGEQADTAVGTENGEGEDEDADSQVALSGAEALANAEKLAAEEKKKLADEEKKICQMATKNLIGLESRPIVRVKDGDGYRVLTAQQKEDKLAETRKQIKDYC